MKNPVYKETTATLADVAEKSGVSRQTVGRILGSGAHKHKPDTVERVKQIANELGYRPNLLAKSVVAGKTYSIGVLIPRANRDDFFADIQIGIQDALLETDWAPIVLQTSEQADERTCIRRLVERRVDGILLIPHENNVDSDHFAEIIERRIPVVTVNTRLKNIEPVDFVGTDEFDGGRQAAEYLLGISNDWKLGVVHSSGPSENLGQRRRGFIQTLETAGKACSTLELTNWTLEDNLAPLVSFLKQSNRPDALFCITDSYAAMVYKAAEQLGLRIPDDLAVIGFADLGFAQYLTPALTTLRQDGRQTGALAIRKLIERIEGRSRCVTETLLKTELISRDSTAPLQTA
ncbi:LacI family DNA-binding transcriptional regulator [Pontiellaceae bacterium B12227]|nr:LacI family DNA-binding transcriptional regulator [Pontiellaceae bacterium B12227]